jgi:hypothetical protein
MHLALAREYIAATEGDSVPSQVRDETHAARTEMLKC